MKINHGLSDAALNDLIKDSAGEGQTPFPPVKQWVRVDVGMLETYVGDSLFVVSFVELLPQTVSEMDHNSHSAEDTVVSYLRKEGFIGEPYVFIGMQRLDLRSPPAGMLDGE